MKMGINFIFEFHVLLFLPPFVSKLVLLGSIQKKKKEHAPPHHQEIEFSNFNPIYHEIKQNIGCYYCK